MSYPAPSPTYVGPAAHTSAGSNMPISRIVLHGTVSPCAAGEARATAAYFAKPESGGSAHYIVDPSEVVQDVYDAVIAWHAPPNPNSIGVEMCDPVAGANGKAAPLSRWKDAGHQAMLQLTATLVAELCLAYDVPAVMIGPRQLRKGAKGICEHSDVSTAWHQSTHWDLGTFPRRAFLRMVQAEIARLTAPPAPAPAPHKPRITRVDRARDLLWAAFTRAKGRRREQLKHAIHDLPTH